MSTWFMLNPDAGTSYTFRSRSTGRPVELVEGTPVLITAAEDVAYLNSRENVSTLDDLDMQCLNLPLPSASAGSTTIKFSIPYKAEITGFGYYILTKGTTSTTIKITANAVDLYTTGALVADDSQGSAMISVANMADRILDADTEITLTNTEVGGGNNTGVRAFVYFKKVGD